MAMNAFGSLPADEIHVERIYASSSWVDDFMECAGFCLRIPHLERHYTINESIVHQFKSKIR
jgi:hypothetical protein